MGASFENGRNHLKVGVTLASNSFALLWKHKILIVYLSASIGLYLLMQFISYNTNSCDISFATGIHSIGPFFDLSHWHHYILLLIFTFAYVFLSTFVTVSLISHIGHCLKDMPVGIIDNVHTAIKRINLILYWSLIITFLAYIIQLILSQIEQQRQFFHPIMVLVGLLGLAWSLITLIVLPIITLEQTTLWKALEKSKNIVMSLLLEIIAGEFWIGLIAVLAMIPCTIPLLIKMNMQIPNIFILSATVLIIITGWIISTVQVIFKTIVYTYYMKPIKELELLKYPRF